MHAHTHARTHARACTHTRMHKCIHKHTCVHTHIHIHLPQWGEAIGFALEKHAQTSFVAHRDNGRIAIDSPEVAAAIWERIRPMTPPHVFGRPATGCNSNIRLYKYQPGQRFGKHIDQSNYLGSELGATEFTVLIYLSEATGGETVFYKDHDGDHEALRYAPRTGSALLHAHGQRCLTHEGSEVRVFSPVSLAGAPPPFAPPTLLLRAAWLSRLRVCSCDGTVWTWCQAGRAVLRM
eukprot:Tamp_15011.p2 GENE.Tamp_15011~~Tamp_15011.p2  ORF type:complete len:236 (+),score=15.88 Tamp_15011:729-1436(+)